MPTFYKKIIEIYFYFILIKEKLHTSFLMRTHGYKGFVTSNQDKHNHRKLKIKFDKSITHKLLKTKHQHYWNKSPPTISESQTRSIIKMSQRQLLFDKFNSVR